MITVIVDSALCVGFRQLGWFQCECNFRINRNEKKKKRKKEKKGKSSLQLILNQEDVSTKKIQPQKSLDR